VDALKMKITFSSFNERDPDWHCISLLWISRSEARIFGKILSDDVDLLHIYPQLISTKTALAFIPVSRCDNPDLLFF